MDTKKVDRLCQAFENRFGRSFASDGVTPLIQLRGKGLADSAKLEMLERFLVQYREALKLKGELQDVVQ